MVDDFKTALAAVQSDFGFYIGCQVDPDGTLAGYDLTPDERSALTDPAKLADVLMAGGLGKFGFTITICGKHDWINRAGLPEDTPTDDTRSGNIAGEAEAITTATTRKERRDASVRLLRLIG